MQGDMPYLERKILSLLKNWNILKLEVRGFRWLRKELTVDIFSRY